MWSLNINEEKKLLILRISDTLTLNELSEFLKEIYDKNDGKYATYNRFTDLSDLKLAITKHGFVKIGKSPNIFLRNK